MLHEHEQFQVVLDDENLVGIFIVCVIHKGILVDIGNVRLEVDNGIFGDVEVYLMLLVNLFGPEGFFRNGQTEGEGGAVPFLALALDGAVVQLDEVACQCQAEACAESLVAAVFTIVEAFKEMLHFVLGDATASIAYLNIYMVVVATGVYVEAYLTLFCVFGGIGEQVVDNLVEFVCVYPSHHALGRTVDGEGEALLGHQRL